MMHDRARELIIDGLVQGLEAADRDELRRHVAECDGCATLQVQQQRLWDELGGALAPAPRSGGLERLRAGIRTVAAELEAPTVDNDEKAGDGDRRWLLRAAVALLLVGVGAVIGTLFSPYGGGGDSERAGRYLVLIHATTAPPEQNEQVGREMNEWISALAADGILESTQGSGDGRSSWLGPTPAQPDAQPAFFVVIRAASLDAARLIAGTAPSLAYGGAVEVRPINERGDP